MTWADQTNNWQENKKSFVWFLDIEQEGFNEPQTTTAFRF